MNTRRTYPLNRHHSGGRNRLAHLDLSVVDEVRRKTNSARCSSPPKKSRLANASPKPCSIPRCVRRSTLEPDALGNANQAIGSLAMVTIPSGPQITSADIGTAVAFALPVRLQPGMRAVSIAIDKVKGVSGMILPGDRVDVIAIPPNAVESAATEGRHDLPRHPRPRGRCGARKCLGDAGDPTNNRRPR